MKAFLCLRLVRQSKIVLALALALGSVVSGCTSSDAPVQAVPDVVASACHDDSGCVDGKHCDPELGCVACNVDSQCTSGQRCAQGQCSAAIACETNADCKGSPFSVCHSGALECVECNVDLDCGKGATCASNHCKKRSKCEKESECLNGSHCDLGTGQCAQCVVDAHCGSGQRCLEDRCVTPCASDAACDKGLHCDGSGQCRECATDAHCAKNRHCDAGRCEVDVCPQGTSTCAPKDGGTRTCSDNGDHFEDTLCPASQTCQADGDKAQCQPWLCSPGVSTCNEAEDAVQVCAADGLSFESSESCAKGEHCHFGKCVTGMCEANQLSCKDGNSYLCAIDGFSLALQASCTATQFCDESSGACRERSCTPGTKMCFAGNVATCRTNGGGYDMTPCPVDQLCVAGGTCKPTLCAPNQSFCSSTNTIAYCDSTGTVINQQVTCNSGAHCGTSSNLAACQGDACTPGSRVCTQSTATVCKADGTGPEAGGTDCAAAGGRCLNGQCVKLVCKPNQLYCDGDLSMVCYSDGSGSSTYQNCASFGLRCNPATANCESTKCSAGAVSCSGNLVVQCDASGFLSTTLKDCATTGQKCSNGACANSVCTPSTTYCKGNDVYTCSSDGTGEYVSTLCGNTAHCTGSYCTSNVCQPGQPVCNGNAVTTCAADGSGPAAAGVACAANQACVSGACQATTCNPNALYCQDSDVMKCNSLGTSATLSQHCFSDSYCDAGTCKADQCPNGLAFCKNEVFATCKADGSGPVSSGTNCAASSQACGFSGCAVQVEDALGTGSKSGAVIESMYTELISVSTARKLVRIDMTMAQTGGTPNWVVYSSADLTTFYRVLTPVAGTLMGPGVASSGPINVQLQAGLYYLIGLYSTGPSWPNYDQIPLPRLSFGTVLGSVTTYASYTSQSIPASSYNQGQSTYRMTLATTLP